MTDISTKYLNVASSKRAISNRAQLSLGSKLNNNSSLFSNYKFTRVKIQGEGPLGLTPFSWKRVLYFGLRKRVGSNIFKFNARFFWKKIIGGFWFNPLIHALPVCINVISNSSLILIFSTKPEGVCRIISRNSKVHSELWTTKKNKDTNWGIFRFSDSDVSLNSL